MEPQNSDAGAVNVIYSKPAPPVPAPPVPAPEEGADAGLSVLGNQYWHQDIPSVRDFSEHGDEFGSALAADDFNGDGHADLAVGVRLENVGAETRLVDDPTVSVINAGAVNLLNGGPSGLSAIGDRFWHQDSPLVSGVAEPGDTFSFALAAANFGVSSAADLAVGVPMESRGTEAAAGVVGLLYSAGPGTGLSGIGTELWHQNRSGVLDGAEGGDHFGSAVASSAGSKCVEATAFLCF